jgi:acyl-CoA thioester hydrolase
MSPAIEIEERVRYSETDQMGVAHNKNYFEWFEIGRTEYCRQKGVSYKEIEAQGYYLVVVEAFCKYRKPLSYDEIFVIRVSLREITPKKVIFDYELLTKAGRKLIASGYTVHIVTNAKAEVSTMPVELMKKISAEQA